ncbi:serine protease 1-like [Uranotaenia lowii]|uniref:serine protease 1-like n=1 Tax=Uranotaenia lowii TaxID=190385 RepID=UPI00247A9A64|nr:serine protease 1-like [Uranotaenia lowii]
MNKLILVVLALLVASASAISNGHEAEPSRVPWAAGVLIHGGSGHSFCSGALISARHVLTSAACINNQPQTMTIALGASSMASIEQVIGVSHILPHPRFSSLLNRDDIAILTMNRDATINDHVRPVQLPRHSDMATNFNGWMATTAGWGNTGNRDNERIPVERLSFVQESIISNFACGITHSFIRDEHICKSTSEGGACNGDEGGPVTIQEAGRTFLIGIHSFHFDGIRGCDRGRAAVNTRITHYLDWIEEHTGIVAPR